jgi:2-aminoadipate transaminase
MTDNRLSKRAQQGFSSAVRDLMARAVSADVLSLAGGRPAVESVPVDRVRSALDDAASELGAASLQYSMTEGVDSLRAVVTERMTAAIERDIAYRELTVTSGSQQGLDLAARVLIDPGDVVLIDDPAYLGALLSLRPYEPRLVGVPLDGDGLRTDIVEDHLRNGLRPKICYHNANFHNPSGSVTSTERRRHLAELADRYGFLVVEDDAYGELWFDEPPPPPIARYSTEVLHLGTSSKMLAPGLRVAWAVGPADVVGAMATAKHGVDLQTGTLVQHAVARLMADTAWLDGHLAKIRRIYAERGRKLAAAMASQLPGVTVEAPKGGMYLWFAAGAGEPPVSSIPLLGAALDRGMAFVPGPEFVVDQPADEWLRLSFATLPVEHFDEAAARLGQAVVDLRTGG